MTVKQISRSLPFVALASLALSFTFAPATFALSKQEFVDVLCSNKSAGVAKCRSDGKSTGKVTVDSSKFKFNDYKDLSKKDFKAKVAKKLAAKPGTTSSKPPITGPNKCAGVDTAIIKCSQTGGGDNLENNGLWAIMVIVIKIMTAGVGILAVGGLSYGAFLWTTAGGNAGQIVKAKNTMINVVIGIVSFALMGALLQFLVPGGVF